MRLWFLSLGAVLAFSVCGYMLAQYAVSFYEDIARWLGATPSIEFVKGVVADLQSKDFAAVEGKSERSIVNEQSRSVLAAIGQPVVVKPAQIESFGRGVDQLWPLKGRQDCSSHYVVSGIRN